MRTNRIALAAGCCLALAAWAQTLQIPDFRQPLPLRVLNPGEPCEDCGRIISIREINLERRAAVPAGFQGTSRGLGESNLVGAVIYLPLSGNTSDRPFVGGVGTPEMRERFGETTYEIAVRLDDGSMRSIRRADGTRFSVGDRVSMAAVGGLERIAE